MPAILLAVETGGTKTLARLCGDGIDIGGRWATTTPQQALEDVAAFAAGALPPGCRVAAAGLAAFGPLLLGGAEAGLMLATSKPGWEGSNLRAALAGRLGCPVAVDTDVNAAARAERSLEAAGDSLAYVTIGTGIGAGLAMPSGTLHGALHPEMGHIRLARAGADHLASLCPFHTDCAEGLAAGPALGVRLGGTTLAERPDIRDLVAGYIAQLLEVLVLAWSPHRIAIGGGVGSAAGMVQAIGQAFRARLGSYGLGPAALAADFVRPARIADAGLAGALAIARELAE